MIRLLSFSLVLVLAAAGFAPPLDAQAGRAINLTGGDTMRYSLTTIRAKPGERLTVVLRTMSTQPASQMAHNFVILKPGTNIDQFVLAASMSKAHGYMPAKLRAQVLVATDMAAANETVRATFSAPTTPGSYTYFCAYPGHFNSGMMGTLVVK
jgi:azurin